MRSFAYRCMFGAIHYTVLCEMQGKNAMKVYRQVKIEIWPMFDSI